LCGCGGAAATQDKDFIVGKKDQKFWFKCIFHFIYCFLGTVATFYAVLLGMNAIVASSLITIIVGFFTVITNDENHYSWASFCGSFAGMASISLVNVGQADSYFTLHFLMMVLIVSTIVSLMYVGGEILSYKAPKYAFDGYGGRLGTIAFISVLIFYLMSKSLWHSEISIFDFRKLRTFDPWSLFMIPSSVAAAMVTMAIKNTVSSLNDNHKVVSIATSGIIGGLLLTTIPKYGMELGQAWYAGAFVGMSSYFILMFKRHFFYSGLISGIFLVLTQGLFIGIGGKLGFISFLAVVTMKVMDTLYNKIKNMGKSSESIIASLQTGDIKNSAVDDDYAQKLVESLMAAKDSGTEIPQFDMGSAGEYVIGAPTDLATYEEKRDSSIHNFDMLSPSMKEMTMFLENIDIKNWVYLYNLQGVYTPLAFCGINEIHSDKISFKENSKFINLIKQENRPIAFENEGLAQSIFFTRFDQEDLATTTMMTILPIYENNEMYGLFIIMDKHTNPEETKNNLKQIKQIYAQIAPFIENERI
jgi:hypothetical protein